MQSVHIMKIHFVEGGPCFFLFGLKEEERTLLCRDGKGVCEQWTVHLLVLTFGRRQRRVCFEERKGEGNGTISTARLGRAAGISLLTNPGRVWRGGAILSSLCHSCIK